MTASYGPPLIRQAFQSSLYPSQLCQLLNHLKRIKCRATVLVSGLHHMRLTQPFLTGTQASPSWSHPGVNDFRRWNWPSDFVPRPHRTGLREHNYRIPQGPSRLRRNFRETPFIFLFPFTEIVLWLDCNSGQLMLFFTHELTIPYMYNFYCSPGTIQQSINKRLKQIDSLEGGSNRQEQTWDENVNSCSPSYWFSINQYACFLSATLCFSWILSLIPNINARWISSLSLSIC